MSILQTYKTGFSKGILLLYALVTLALVFFFVGIIVFIKSEEAGPIPILISIVVLIGILFAGIFFRAYRIHFDITEDTLIIHGVFKTHSIPLTAIKEARRSPLPFGFRLFGASLLSGLYYFPSIGATWVAMGNFTDGVLLTTHDGKHYFITPQNPEVFLKNIQHA